MARGNARKSQRSSPAETIESESAQIVDIHGRSGATRLASAQFNCSNAGRLALPDASEELAAAVRETGNAVHVIIDQAEAILDHDNKDARAYRAAVQSAMLRILEVCSFEDLTGQRIAKAADVLRRLEQAEVTDQNLKAAATCDSETEARLDGPALNAPHMSQAEIDTVFSG